MSPEPQCLKRFMADCEIASHGCLPANVDSLVFKHPRGLYEIVIGNLELDAEEEYSKISLQAYFFCKDIAVARSKAKEVVTQFLYLLSFTTNVRLKLLTIARIADWSPGLQEREAHYYLPVEGHGQPLAIFDQRVVATIESLELVERSPALNRAMKWFSLGVRAFHTDEQFTYFWFCIEILAQLDKPIQKIKDKCPKCRNPLYCEACANHPSHRPYPKQIIEHAIAEVMNGNHEEFFEVASRFRHALMHGDALEEIEADIGTSLGEVVDRVGSVAWDLLMKKLATAGKEALANKNLSVLRPTTYRHETAHIVSQVFFGGRDPDEPRLTEMPKATLSVKFGKEP